MPEYNNEWLFVIPKHEGSVVAAIKNVTNRSFTSIMLNSEQDVQVSPDSYRDKKSIIVAMQMAA
jgi:hypothetical protein